MKACLTLFMLFATVLVVLATNLMFTSLINLPSWFTVVAAVALVFAVFMAIAYAWVRFFFYLKR